MFDEHKQNDKDKKKKSKCDVVYMPLNYLHKATQSHLEMIGLD